MANKISEGIDILEKLGLPKKQQNDRSSLTLLTLLKLKETDSWMKSKKRNIKIHDILIYIKEEYKVPYAENTRETIRRQTLHQFVQAGIAVMNSDNPSRPTNSPNNVYSITDEALEAIKAYGTPEWKSKLGSFIKQKGKLIDMYDKKKKQYSLSLNIEGKTIQLSPGKHNELQIDIVNNFRPRFCPDTKIIYIGDTAKKNLYNKTQVLNKLGIPITKHDKLPDVVLYSEKKGIIILVEAVTSHGPVSPKRHLELEKVLKKCKVKRIYVSAFPDYKEFKKYMDDIAWDTEVWIAVKPEHMIHFNGPKFFNVYK